MNLHKYATIMRVLRRLRSFRSHDALTPEGLARYQAEALKALRQHASQHSPFYQNFHKGLEHAPLHELPVLTKQIVMDNFDALVTDREVRLGDVQAHVAAGSMGRFHGRYEVVATSGSTGRPGLFLFDPDEWATIVASFGRSREWAGLKINLLKPSKMAVVSSVNDKNLSARVGKAADTPFIPTLRFDATEPLEHIDAQLNRWQPESVVGYASMAYALAHEQAAGALAIHPKYVFTSSEVLTPHMRSAAEAAWGKVVYDVYAATEAAAIAAECPAHHGLHVYEDLLIVENVDHHNQPVPPGQFGDKLLVTNLSSRTQPLIRYEVSDSVRFATGSVVCHLPYKIIDGVEGRVEETLTLPGGIKIRPGIFHNVMDIVPNKGWQVLQTPDGLKVLVVGLKTGTDAQKINHTLNRALAEKGVGQVKISVDEVDAIPKAASGKTPLIKALKVD